MIIIYDFSLLHYECLLDDPQYYWNVVGHVYGWTIIDYDYNGDERTL